MPFKRVTTGPKKKRARGSSSRDPEFDPEVENEEIDLATIPEEEWPENTRERNGIKFLDKKFEARYDALLTRKLVPSRFVHLPTLNQLGIKDEVETLLRSINLWDFLTSNLSTYRTLTLEFVASIVKEEEYRTDTSISFQLDGKKFTLNDNQLCESLHVSVVDDMSFVAIWGVDMSQAEFEQQLFGAPRSTYGANQIQHPALRYIQRVLAFSILGRGESSGKMNVKDVFFLHCMLYVWKDPSLKPHVGYFLLFNLLKIASSKKPNGVISAGGIVTRIAEYLRILGNGPIHRTLVSGPTQVTLEQLATAKLIKREGEKWY